jgi:hypothetical protein
MPSRQAERSDLLGLSFFLRRIEKPICLGSSLPAIQPIHRMSSRPRGAHPVSGYRIDDHFIIGVLVARAISPISKTNWEGSGVEPDIKVSASEALDVAKKMAAEQINQAQR